MAVMLRELGHHVEFAINGRAALELARKLRPQILFIDMVLPDFDGSDLSRLLRKQLEPDKPCVVIITGATGEATRKRALDAGCDEFFLKPLDWEKLDRVLNA